MVANRILVWDKLALNHLKEIYDSLKAGRNLSYADRVKNTILRRLKNYWTIQIFMSKIDLSLIMMEVLEPLKNINIE
jgi:hypothetical protein